MARLDTEDWDADRHWTGNGPVIAASVTVARDGGGWTVSHAPKLGRLPSQSVLMAGLLVRGAGFHGACSLPPRASELAVRWLDHDSGLNEPPDQIHDLVTDTAAAFASADLDIAAIPVGHPDGEWSVGMASRTEGMAAVCVVAARPLLAARSLGDLLTVAALAFRAAIQSCGPMALNNETELGLAKIGSGIDAAFA